MILFFNEYDVLLKLIYDYGNIFLSECFFFFNLGMLIIEVKHVISFRVFNSMLHVILLNNETKQKGNVCKVRALNLLSRSFH